MSFSNLILALKGGSGSGNFGHSGRPGKIGGSGAVNTVTIGSMIGKGTSEYASNATLSYSKLNGVNVPGLNQDQVYVVRYSTNDESKSINYGLSAYVGRNLDDLIESASAYRPKNGEHVGYMHIGRSVNDDYNEGEEITGIIGTPYAPVNVVVDVSDGRITYSSYEDPI